MEFLYVGSLRDEIPPTDQDEVADELLETFNCVPMLLLPDLLTRFYHGFCKQQLWPCSTICSPTPWASVDASTAATGEPAAPRVGGDRWFTFRLARGRGKDVKEVETETRAMVKWIDEAFGEGNIDPPNAYDSDP